MPPAHDAGVREEELQAYVDGLLDVGRRGTVEAYLALHPDEAERVTAYRAQNVALHQAFDFMTKIPLPAGMEGMAEKLSARPRGGALRIVLRCALGLALAAAAGAGGWLANDQWTAVREQQQPFPSFTRRAIEAHALLSEEGAPALPGDAAESGKVLVGWLGGPAPRSAPDLKDFGLALAGGRIFFIGEQLVVQLIYEGGRNSLGLYVGAVPVPGDARRTSFTFARQDGLSTFHWRQGRLEFSLIGRMERARLLDVATAVHDALGMTAAVRERRRDREAPAGAAVTAAEGGGFSRAR